MEYLKLGIYGNKGEKNYINIETRAVHPSYKNSFFFLQTPVHYKTQANQLRLGNGLIHASGTWLDAFDE